MAAERAGQQTANFQAELMGRELSARRNEIAQALSSQQGLISGDQTRALQAQLAALDQAISQTNATTSRQSVNNQYSLGQRQLELQLQQLLASQDMQMRRLGLDASIAQDDSNYKWSFRDN
jgi:flagellar biosynthesis chaperone FliJ